MRMHKEIGRVVSGFLAALTLAASMPYAAAETRNGEVLTYLKSENLPYEIVYYDTAAEQQQALVGGAVDVISSVSLSPVANTRIVAQFAPRPYYFASTKGNAALIDQMDETIRRIDLVEPNLQDSLYDNYFRVVNDAFYLTDAQKAALADMGTLRVLCTENAAPYAYRAGEAPAGMLVSILNNYIYSISEDELAGYLSTGNLHPDSSSVLLFARRHPVQAMMAVTAVTALVAAIVVCLLLRASRQRTKMQATHNRQLSQALQIARDANEAKTTFLSNMSHDIRTP